MIAATKAWLVKKLLTREQRDALAIFEDVDRWQPDPQITPEEARRWGEILKEPLLLKIDIAMVNMSAQTAAHAISTATPTQDVIRQAGHALGFRRGWQTAKALSVMLATKAEQPDDAAQGTAILDQHSP